MWNDRRTKQIAFALYYYGMIITMYTLTAVSLSIAFYHTVVHVHILHNFVCFSLLCQVVEIKLLTTNINSVTLRILLGSYTSTVVHIYPTGHAVGSCPFAGCLFRVHKTNGHCCIPSHVPKQHNYIHF